MNTSVDASPLPPRELFRALGVETNYRILSELFKAERCACELPALVGKTQSNTSMHLAKLLRLGLVGVRRDGKRHVYSLTDARARRTLAACEAGR